MSIVRHSGRWTVNGNNYQNMNEEEKQVLSTFIVFMKESYKSKQKPKNLIIKIKT